MKRLFKTMLCIGIMYSSYSNFAVNAHVKEEIQENGEFNQLRLPVNQRIDFYAVDYTAPQVNEKSLQVDKQTVRPGEVVKVSLQVTDDISGVEDVQIQYEKPISKNKQWISLKYNYSTGLYEGSIFVDESTESGVWKIDCIVVSDYKDNTDWVYNIELNPYESGKNLSQGNFIVTQLIGSGWQRIDGTWYYFNKSGEMQTGWLKEGNTWYYLKSSGAMATGWEKVNGTWYYFKSSGAMQTGWLREGNTWYYLKSSGAMATGWEKVNGTWYYFYSSGKMATSGVIDGWKITSSGAAYKM